MTTRREFLKTVAIGSTVLVGSTLVSTPNLLADAPAKITSNDMVSEDVGTAQGLKYCRNADKESKGKAPKCETCVDKTKRCKTCNYYSTAGKMGAAEVGKCLLIQDQGAKYVYAAGCCSQWAVKQKS
jgi:hypothetical protein